MPFLRVIRDKRGYETTYLMHWFREGNRQQSRILYVFRGPAGVRVGRPAMEPEVLRVLEARHPDIEFDWPAVLDNRQVVEPPSEQRRQRKPRRRDEDGPAAGAPPTPPPAAEAQRPRFVVPSRVEGDTPDAQIAFIAKWHALIREQIDERVADPGRREALVALANRLNPAGWVDADEKTTGLQQAGEALERLSHVFAKRRRRSRKKKPGAAAQPDAPAASDSTDDEVPDSTDSVPDSTDEVLGRTDSVLEGTDPVLDADSTDD